MDLLANNQWQRIRYFGCLLFQNWTMFNLQKVNMAGPSPTLTASRLHRRFKPCHSNDREYDSTPSSSSSSPREHSSLQYQLSDQTERENIMDM